LKYDLHRPSGPGATDQLKTILELLVPPHDEAGEEALHGLFERNPMEGEFVAFEVILEITRLEAIPVYQTMRPYS
jgi:hypothetical protein